MKKLILLLSVAALFSCNKQKAGTPASLASGYINTVAGDGVYGYSGDGGAAVSAELNYPGGVAVDAAGNLYIADGSNNRIRKVNTAGVITTVAGNGLQGSAGDGGPATAAELRGPSGIAIDNTGNIYIADEFNGVIRMVNTSGVITTYAGNDTIGFSGDGGPAIHASLNLPAGVAADDSGNIYIADMGNQRIRKVNTSGIISTVAGSGNGTGAYGGDGGAATGAALNSPVAVLADKSGNLYVADMNNNRVRMINAAGIISTVAGSGIAAYGGDSSAASSAYLHNPSGIALDGEGNIYISDSYNQRIRKVSAAGIIYTYAGTANSAVSKIPLGSYGGDAGPAIQAQLFGPYGLATDASGNLYVADQQNNRIRKVNK